MAKKKKICDLSKENIEFIQDNITYKVLHFNPNYAIEISKDYLCLWLRGV